MDNNHSENALRVVASGRKAWLFFCSDDHAQAAANLYSLIAGCKLHGIDPERYLAEVIRVMPYWPPERYLEIAPAYWGRPAVASTPPNSLPSWATSPCPRPRRARPSSLLRAEVVRSAVTRGLSR
jgi:hypothetical protein